MHEEQDDWLFANNVAQPNTKRTSITGMNRE